MKTAKRKYISWILIMLLITGISSCKRFLDAKPDGRLGTLSSLPDIQAFLDGTFDLNEQKYPAEGEIGADTYYIDDLNYNSLPDFERNQYSWSKDINGAATGWQGCYKAIYTANLALSSLADLESQEDQELYSTLKGRGLFFRGFYYFALSQLYILPYDKATAKDAPGLPLRLDPAFQPVSKRSNIQLTYDQIISDLKDAASLLPVEGTPKTRPSKAAAFAMLSRVYLSMREYDSAGVYADKSLKLYSSLMEYSDLTASSSAPVPLFNKEIIFWTTSQTPSVLSEWNAIIDPLLYQSYSSNDLRKAIFFEVNTGTGSDTFYWKGGYHGGGTYIFGGLVTDEIYLTRAECFARAGQTNLAMKDLNDLLRTRWRKINGVTTYVDQTALNSNEALILILAERKKELLYRGLRWNDMRRLSMEPAFSETFKRAYNTPQYSIATGSPRYVLLIPFDVIDRSGMPQNP